MKKYICAVSILVVLFSVRSEAQLSSLCTPLSKPNPQAPEPMFQLPFEAGDGLKLYSDRPDPYMGYVNILPTVVVIKRTLKTGVGPEIIWSDLSPQYGGKAKASFDIKDLNIASLNNIPIGSLLFSLWGNWSSRAPVYGAGLSFEFGKFLSAGGGASYFADGSVAGLEKHLSINPFFYEGKEEPAEPAISGNQSLEEKYYKRFVQVTRSTLGAQTAVLDLVKSHSGDRGWNALNSIASLKDFMNQLAGTAGSTMIDQIVDETRKANAIDNLSVQENEGKVVDAILQGFCKLTTEGGGQ